MEIFQNLNQYGDFAFAILRFVIGVVFLYHGAMKFAMWKMQPSAQMPGSMINLMRFLSIAEPLGAIAVLVGFLTQLAALGLGIIMVGAIIMKMKMWKAPFMANDKTGWEFDFALLGICVTLFLLGAGSFALDPLFFG